MTNPYETDELVNQYLAFHYGETYFDVPNYAVRCAEICLQAMQGRPMQRALDLGCAVGRSTFELARGFDEAAGIDLSGRFVEAAQALQAGRTLPYFLHDEGVLGHPASASLNDLGLTEAAGRTHFAQGDACQLDASLGQFDLVFAGNLIDRVQNPAAFLKSLQHVVKPGGLLVVSSPYTLLNEYTPRQNWLGGVVVDGENKTMLQGMTLALAPAFVPLCDPQDVPFVIRETARKYQHSVAQLTIWVRQ